ncbi:MAG: hypothetical protein M3541_00125 [Acidobacteriota bacterium]|nr:hypothetical protein [Acidobacteriota bacterium]
MTRTRALSAVAALTMFFAAAPAAQAQTAAGSDLDPRIQKLIASVSEERMKALLTKLSSFTTRNTMSDPDLPNGLGAARQWILDEMTRTSPKLQVGFDTHMIPASGRITTEVELRNIIAVLPGKSPRRIYVSGHYDSLNIPGQGGRAEGTAPQGQGAGRAYQGATAQTAAGNTQAAGRGAGARLPGRMRPPAADEVSSLRRTTTWLRRVQTTMAAAQCCRWNWRECSPRAGSSSMPRSSS